MFRLKSAPEGHLRISSEGKRTQFYHRAGKKDIKGKYIRLKKRSLAVDLARKDFYLKLDAALEKDQKLLDDFLHHYHPSSIEDTYENLSEDRKSLIGSVWMSDQEYAEQWQSQEYQGLGFSEESREYYTDKGERVRSKSEIIIGNQLASYGVPYRYEYPVVMKDGLVLYPDFYCLNIRTRKELILEHFGMMDNPEYAEDAVRKVNKYEKDGYMMGVNLIMTFETMENPLNVKTLKKKIERYLL